ncbi:DUF6883 domain-containing protein [Citrobacter braakii]|uniref:DUF6883 domain-containing protein n=1 Tax=Citrobacter braakii TaxID=57706 RepID=UPI003978E7AB
MKAIAESDTRDEIHARIRRGDILVHNMAYELSRLLIIPQPLSSTWTTQSNEYRPSHRKWATVVGDMVDTLEEQWCTTDRLHLADKLSETMIYCLSVHPIELHLAQCIDDKLRHYEPYLGAIELDSMNPLHHKLFYADLLDCVYLKGKTMFASKWDIDEGVHEFGITANQYFSLHQLKYREFMENAPRFPKVVSLSERGKVSQKRLISISKDNHFSKVANELIRFAKEGQKNLHVDLKILPPEIDQLKVPVEKLLNYALNVDHKEGKHKARIFKAALGIEAKQWRYLAFQLGEEMKDAKLEVTHVTEHGIKHRAFLQIAGLNGKMCKVRTAWIISPNEPAKLVTAYPEGEDEDLVGHKYPSLYVPMENDMHLRWEKIFFAASKMGEEASMECVPNPIHVEGIGIDLEGQCGGAFVQIKNNKGFSGWLITNGHALQVSRSRIQIPVRLNTQSVDRAIAYAKAFSKVLWLNDIDEVSVKSYLS